MRRPDRRKPPKVETAPAPRMMELLGLTDDGRLVLWDTGLVQPVGRFETTDGGCWIKGGHYVIEWEGHAITVHCGNMLNGNVCLLFMCSSAGFRSVPRAEVEAMLIGKVIESEESKATTKALLKALGDLAMQGTNAPDRQRGRIR